MKKTIKYLVMIATFICCAFTLFACGVNGEAILQSYIFDKDGGVVTSDFVLPGEIGGEKAVWASDNDAVKLEKIEDGYRAVINIVDERQDVGLTVTVGKASQTYHVFVNAIDPYSFMDNYIFAYDRKIVVENFNLDQTCTYKGRTAQITWSVDDQYADYLEIDGDVCKVYVSSLNPSVKINATFTYNGQSATKKYPMTVSLPQTDEEKWVYWYDNTGITQTLSGYVVHKGPWTKYNDKYEAILYCVDDSLTFGFYLYNEIIDLDEETYNAMPLGTHITCTNPLNASYNGLMETSNYKGHTTIDSDIPAIDVTAYDYENDLLGQVPAYRYAQSKLVSLTNWQIKSIEAASGWYAQSTNKILTLEKAGVEISVAISKYHIGMTAPNNETNVAIATKLSEFGVGSYINVTGVLGWYNAPQIVVFDASMVTAGVEDTRTEFAGKVVGQGYAQFRDALTSNNLDKKVTTPLTATLPTSFNETGTITYQLMSSSQAVTLENGALSINPGKSEKVHVRVEFSYGGYTTFDYFYISSEQVSDAGMVAHEKAKLVNFTAEKNVELQSKGKDYETVAISWALKEEVEGVNLNNGTLELAQGLDTTAVLVATLQSGEAIDTVEITVTIKTPAINETGTWTDPLSPATAIALAGQLDGDSKEESKEYYYIKGVIVDDPTADYCNFCFADGEKQIKAWGLWTYDGTNRYGTAREIHELPVKKGDEVILYGNLQNFNGTLEIKNARLIALNGTYNTQEDPQVISAATAITLAGRLDAETKEESTHAYYIKGVIVDDPTADYCNFCFADGEKQIKAWGLWTYDGTNRYGTAREIHELPVKKGDEVILYGNLQNFNGTLEIKNAKLIELNGVSQKPADENPPVEKTPEEIVAEAYALEGTATLSNITLTGVVSEIVTEYSEQYKNITFNIVIGTLTDKPIQCFRAKGADGVDVSTIQVGNTITITGTIKKYEGTVEFDAGSLVSAITNGEGGDTPAEKTPEQIVTEAYALEGTATLSNITLTGKVTEIVTAYSEQYKNITFNIVIGTLTDKPIQCFRAKGAEGIDVSTIKEGDTITITGTIKNFNGTIEFDAGSLVSEIVAGQAVVTNPLEGKTEAEIVAMAYELGVGEFYNDVTLTGVITEIVDEYSEQYQNITFNIVVGGLTEKPIQCFRVKAGTGMDITTLAAGDTVTVNGKIKNYKGTIEFDAGSLVNAITKAN